MTGEVTIELEQSGSLPFPSSFVARMMRREAVKLRLNKAWPTYPVKPVTWQGSFLQEFMALISWDHEGEATAPNSIHLQQLKYRLSRIFMLECFCANQVLCRK